MLAGILSISIRAVKRISRAKSAGAWIIPGKTLAAKSAVHVNNGPAARTPLLHGHIDSEAAFLYRFLPSGQRKRACDGVWFLVDDYQQDARCSIRMTSVLFPIA